MRRNKHKQPKPNRNQPSPQTVHRTGGSPSRSAANAGSLINYGERFRSGERISSAMAESTVNCVISKRFAKRQQVQWTRRGARLLLQTRTRALDGTLRPLFERWFPGMANDNANGADQAAVA